MKRRFAVRRWRILALSVLWLGGALTECWALQAPAPASLPQAAALPALPGSDMGKAMPAALSASRVQELSGQLGRMVEIWVHQGDAEPESIRTLLAQMVTDEPPPTGVPLGLWRQNLWFAQALIAARQGDWPALEAVLKQLHDLDPDRQDARLRADQALAWAQYAMLSGDAPAARTQAQAAQQDYALVCQAKEPAMACNLRAWWYSLDVLTEQASMEGRYVQARDWALRAQKVARRAADEGLELLSVLRVAYAQHALGQYGLAQQTLGRMVRPVQGESLQVALLQWRLAEVALGQARLPRETQLLKLTEAWELSQQIGADCWAVPVQLALARYWLDRRPERALVLAQEGLQTLAHVHDVSLRAQLVHVAGLARLLLRQSEAGQADLATAQQLWKVSGAWAHQAAGWREASFVLERLGRLAEALQYFHQERALLDRIEQDNRQALIAELRERFAVATKQHDLEQLSRAHSLEQAQLEHQALVVRLVVFAVLFLVLVFALMMLLAMRARDLTRKLRHSEGELRLQSERDVLTGLVNRRHVSNRLQTAQLYDDFQGGVLLLDIDHFKRINDEQGHAAGDAVLVEVAARLQRVVRDCGVVSRWGGEEFLIWVDDPVQSLDALAQRILHAVGDVPVVLAEGPSLAVTVSLGYGLFPPIGSNLTLGWERALKLIDMLLYAAKQQGRDRAIGLLALCPSTRLDDVDRLDCRADVRALGLDTRLSLYRRQQVDFSLLTPGASLPSAESFPLGRV